MAHSTVASKVSHGRSKTRGIKSDLDFSLVFQITSFVAQDLSIRYEPDEISVTGRTGL